MRVLPLCAKVSGITFESDHNRHTRKNPVLQRYTSSFYAWGHRSICLRTCGLSSNRTAGYSVPSFRLSHPISSPTVKELKSERVKELKMMRAGVLEREAVLVRGLCRCLDVFGAVGTSACVDSAVFRSPEIIISFWIEFAIEGLYGHDRNYFHTFFVVKRLKSNTTITVLTGRGVVARWSRIWVAIRVTGDGVTPFF